MPRDYSVFDIRYPEKIRYVLLSAGTVGLSFHDLHQKTKTQKYKASDLQPILDAWHKRRWVDRYVVARGYHSNTSQTIWRATRLLDTEWKAMLALVRDLLIEGPPSGAVAQPLDQDASLDQSAHPAVTDPAQPSES